MDRLMFILSLLDEIRFTAHPDLRDLVFCSIWYILSTLSDLSIRYFKID
jgi:hypothetical protein